MQINTRVVKYQKSGCHSWTLQSCDNLNSNAEVNPEEEEDVWEEGV